MTDMLGPGIEAQFSRAKNDVTNYDKCPVLLLHE